MGVKALYYNCLDIGKRVKKSKRRFTWKFSIDGREHMVDLVISYLSGKKKITHNGKLLYEGQKIITSSFQFPFEIDLNMCNVVQQGEMYELRINNQAFSQLYSGGGSGRGDYEGESRGGSRSKGGYEPASKTRDDFDGKSNYGGYGSGSYGGTRATADSGYSKPSGTSYGRAGGAWEDVRQAEKGVRKDGPSKVPNFKEDTDNAGFSSEFDKFDYRGGSNRNEDAFDSRQNKPSYNRAQTGGQAKTAFDDFQVEQPKKAANNFADFSDFNNFGGNTSQQKPSTQSTSNNAFTGFDNFGGGFNKPQNASPPKNDAFGGFAKPPGASPPQRQEVQRSQTVPPTNMDILGLDFTSSVTVSQPQNTQANTQNAGFDFFGQPAAPTTNQNQGFNQPPPTNVSQTKGPSANDLLALDFGAPVAQQQQTQDNNANQGGFDFLGGDQPATQPTTQTQPQTQAQPQASKSDLWSSDLVSLSSNEVDNTKNKNPYGNQNYGMYGNQGNQGNQGYNAGYGGGMNNYGGMGSMGGMSNMNMNTGMGGMNMNAGFGGNMGNSNASGFGGMNSMGMNAGFGGNMSQQSMGGNMGQSMGGNMQGNMGYSNTQQNNFGMGGGFQQPTNQASTGADLSTPFDF